MKIHTYRIVFHAALLAFLISGILSLFTIYNITINSLSSIFAISIFSSINLLSDLLYLRLSKKDEKTFMVSILLLRGFKFLLYLIITLVVLKVWPQESRINGLLLVGLFFLYTIIEILFLKSVKKK